ncbi:MAG: biotin--[acetyl-CoA-carboxylase] ligase [Verrucomicrobia bacterium]|jgi:BirA family transcriptional regulator, biotin operon repressor / biotin---[acetyl-CoA-carboxylase] ligase|nr:biotin--[acetyl-CoA-carboxylase] ligase [Verrucomicrobiota bacterium]MBT7064898.1 biotin--[acetyl-CoA-carboxylase] ligase [Verrucomicrobiota bacterium]MBT7699975.1 biotin--[acetyl-CoA-carboxylase] ligase [Verrucomicrobiota bacterium]
MSDVTDRVLTALREQDDWCSGERIGAFLNISRASVSKHIAALRRLGYDIQSVSRRGHRLITAPNMPYPAEVRRHLRSARIGQCLHYVPDIDSTNTRAAADAKAGAAEGTVWVSDQQSAGRGRMDRTWHSAPGANLYASVILRPSVPVNRISEIGLVAAVAIERALLACHPDLAALIKWPNDILVERRKLCGVLCESEVEADAIHFAIIGFGINVNETSFPAALKPTATSLCLELGREVSRPELLAAVLNALDDAYGDWLAAEDLSPFLPYLEAHSVLQGRDVTVSTFRETLRGRVQSMSPSGELILVRDKQTTVVSAGDVTVRGW